MTPGPLFDPTKVAPDTDMAHGESMYAYIGRSDRAPVGQVRDLLEDWFTRVPKSDAADVAGRVRSGDDGSFLSAFWEMYLAETLTRLGYAVDWHPELAHTGKRPDFRATDSDGQSTYLEAVVVSMPRGSLAEQRRLAVLYDQIQKWEVPNFFLNVTLYSVGQSAISTRKMRDAVIRWVADQTPEDVRSRYIEGGWEALPTYPYRDAGWRIEFGLILKSDEARARGDLSAMGTYSAGVGGQIDNVTPLRNVVVEKSSDYGNLEAPFIVAALHNGPIFRPSIRDVATALWGHWEPTESGEMHLLPMSGDLSPMISPSLWRSPAGDRYTRTSAVVVALGLSPANLVEEAPQVWRNPNAQHPASMVLPYGTWTVANDVLAFSQASEAVAEVLGLRRDWPGWHEESDTVPGDE